MAGIPWAVLLMTAFFALRAVWAIGSVTLYLPFLTHQPPSWRVLLLYGGGALYVCYLCWRRSPRARFASYIFLSVDLARAIRGMHWGVAVVDLAVIGFMQLPAWRTAYPAIRPAMFRHRRRSPNPLPVNGRFDPHGSAQPGNGGGRVIHP